MGQALTDGLDLAMTFIPLGAAGAGSVARTTARDMAASRTLMKEGAKEATQATGTSSSQNRSPTRHRITSSTQQRPPGRPTPRTSSRHQAGRRAGKRAR